MANGDLIFNPLRQAPSRRTNIFGITSIAGADVGQVAQQAKLPAVQPPKVQQDRSALLGMTTLDEIKKELKKRTETLLGGKPAGQTIFNRPNITPRRPGILS